MTRLVASVDEAVEAIRNGLVIALATDTVYGLAVDAGRKDAGDVLSRLKERSGDVPVQVLVSGMEQALSIGDFSPDALRGSATLWPGAATLVVPVRRGVELHLGGDGSTVGIRWPAHLLAAELCARCGPLAATSANRHGATPLETAAEVAEAFSGQIALVLDGGRCPGLASTVVDLTGDSPRVLRVGAVAESVVSEAFSNRSD